jgi:hypothetical protein
VIRRGFSYTQPGIAGTKQGLSLQSSEDQETSVAKHFPAFLSPKTSEQGIMISDQ